MAGSGSIGLNGDDMVAEPQEGNIEYKLMLVAPSEERLQHLTTQLKWRVLEGHGMRDAIHPALELSALFSQRASSTKPHRPQAACTS
jgi:hypothetical protein